MMPSTKKIFTTASLRRALHQAGSFTGIIAVALLPATAMAQSAPIVVLEYPHNSQSGDYDGDNPFLLDRDYSTRHKVETDETLSHVIDTHYAGSGLNLQFIQMAIVAANSHAFVRNNPNFLYAGKTLHLPSLNEIQAMVLGQHGKQTGTAGTASSRSDAIYFIGG